MTTQGVLPDGGRRATVESDGTITSAGYTNLGEGLGNDVVLLRQKPDGTPDTSFGFGTPSLPGVGVSIGSSPTAASPSATRPGRSTALDNFLDRDSS
jgi:hypothetical protein